MKQRYYYLLIPIIYEGIVQAYQYGIRRLYFQKVSQIAKENGKPLLVIGNPQGRHPCGDVMIDISPTNECPVGISHDIVKPLDYSFKYFGGCYVGHVIEHLSLVDAKQAIENLLYVSDYLLILYPTIYSIKDRFIPDHKLETLEYLWSINPNGVMEFYD